MGGSDPSTLMLLGLAKLARVKLRREGGDGVGG